MGLKLTHGFSMNLFIYSFTPSFIQQTLKEHSQGGRQRYLGQGPYSLGANNFLIRRQSKGDWDHSEGKDKVSGKYSREAAGFWRPSG